MQQYTRVDYHPGLDQAIRNLDVLPPGTGCRYLRCLYVKEGELVARSWHRKSPRLRPGEAVVVFPEKSRVPSYPHADPAM